MFKIFVVLIGVSPGLPPVSMPVGFVETPFPTVEACDAVRTSEKFVVALAEITAQSQKKASNIKLSTETACMDVSKIPGAKDNSI
jgi:hypothetical protein